MAPRPLPARRRPVDPPDADGTAHARVRLDANEHAPRAAREHALRLLIAWGMRERAIPDVVRLGVSELVTHAVRDTDPAAAVTVSVRCEHGWAHVAVTDDSRHHPTAFATPNGDDTTETNPPPGQLGLHVVRRLVEAAGGHTAVDEPPGGHRELVVSLPMAHT